MGKGVFRLSAKQERQAKERAYIPKVCPTCNGAGNVPSYSANPHLPHRCQHCGGCGRLWGTKMEWQMDRRNLLNEVRGDRRLAEILKQAKG